MKEIFNNNIPEVVRMKYIYKGLDIAENAKQSYIENNTIIGSPILDNTETFGIITYDINNKSLNSYSFQRSEYSELTNSIHLQHIVMPRIVYIFQGEKKNNLMK
jgi:predicted transcriptional regulator